MTKKTLFTLLLILFTLLPMSAMGAGKTAKALLPKAIAEAKKWQPDAALVNLTTSNAELDGTVPVKPIPGVWAYTFLSQKTKKKILVTVDATGEVSKLDSSYFKNDVVGEFIVDSDKAMTEAIKNGLKTNKFGMKMSLEKQAGRVEWQMMDDRHFYYIDASSGKFLRKEKTD